MKYILFALIGFCNVISPCKLHSQELTIQETLDYINEKLNLDGNKESGEEAASYEWSVTKDGKLIIKRFWNKILSSETNVYLKQLDTNLVEVYSEKGNSRIFGLIKIYSKNENAITNRFLKKVDSEEKIYHSFMINVSFSADQILTNQMKKAIDHLIILSKAKKEFREKDPFSD